MTNTVVLHNEHRVNVFSFKKLTNKKKRTLNLIKKIGDYKGDSYTVAIFSNILRYPVNSKISNIN